MPRQKQDRPKRTKCSVNESTSSDVTLGIGQESDSPGDGDKMNLDDCNSSSSSSGSTSSSSTQSPSSSRSSSPQPPPATTTMTTTATVNTTKVEESGEINSVVAVEEKIYEKEKINTDLQQNDNLTLDNNSNHHLYQKQLSPIREESYSLQEEEEEENLLPSSPPPPPPLVSSSSPPQPPPLVSSSSPPQPQHKQSSSSPPPPSLLLSSSSPSNLSPSQQPLTNNGMSTDDKMLTNLITTPTTKQTSPSPLTLDDSPPSLHSSTHSTSYDDTNTLTTPDTENEVNNNISSNPDDTVIDVPMDQSGTPSPLPNTPTSLSPSKLTSTHLNRKRKVSTTDSMMTTTTSVSPTSSLLSSTASSITKPQSTLCDSFVKPSPTPESGTTATTSSSSSSSTSSKKVSTTSPQPPLLPPPPPPPPLLPPSLTSQLSNVDEKLLKDLSQSSLINSLILNSRNCGSILPDVQKSLPPPPLSLTSPTPQTTPTSTSSKQQQQQQPIYVAISTNPLILVPLSYNSETGGLDLSLNNSTSVVKLPNDTLLNTQLNGLIASGIDRSTNLLNNPLETHHPTIIDNNNHSNLINGIDSTNIINVNNLTNNNIISIANNSAVNSGDNVNSNNLRNLNLNNIQQLSQFSGRPQSTEGPLDLSSNPSSVVDSQSNDNKLSFHHHNRHHPPPPHHHHHHHHSHRDTDHHHHRSSSSSVASYKVKNEIDPMVEESESPSPLNLFNSPSTFANLVSSAHSADLPQSTASVLAAAAVAAAAAASASSPPSSSTLTAGNGGGGGNGPTLPGSIPSLPTPFTPEAVFKQSSYHCEHCHIGFYKKENYTIHKRFYCSARRSKAAAAAALAAASAGGGGSHSRSRANTRTRSESSPDLLESDGSPNSSPEISLDSEKTDRNLTHHHSSSSQQQQQQSHQPQSHRKSSTSRRVSVSSKTNASNSSNSPGSSPPHQPLSQYYCVACGIRFTSLDNLQAHQTYYCLKRNSVNTSPDKLQYIVSIPGGTGSEVSCVKCKATYCNEEAFLSHVCSAMSLNAITSAGGSNGSKYLTSTSTSSSSGNGNGSNNDGRCSSAGGGSTSGGGNAGNVTSSGTSNSRRQEREDIDSGQQCFRCTICGYKGQTLQGMRIHVRMHSQCFRCTICGYKGHTLRGMRTHVRIHQDKIQGLPEETFIACIEDDALVTKSTTRNGPTGSKRRRKSLDGYSNSNSSSNVHNQFVSSTLSSLSNVIISENSKPLSSQLINNLLPSTIANTSSSSTGPAGILVSAGYSSNNNSNSNVNNSGTNDELISGKIVDRKSSNIVNNLNGSHSEISSENEDEATSNLSENEMSGRDDSRQGGGSGESVHNCHLCYYSSTYKGNVVRHLKLVHKDNSGSSGGGSSGTNGPFSGLNKRDPGDQVSEMDVTPSGGDSHGEMSDDLPLDLKATRSNGSTFLERRRTFNNRSPSMGNNRQSAGSPIDHNSNGSSSNNNNNNSNNNNNGSSNSSAQAKKAVPKYCRSCDISFQFLTSFIAHKKYYCSSHSNDPNAIQHLPESKSPV